MYDFRHIAGDGPPIRALQHRIVKTLEDSDPAFLDMAKKLIAKYGLKPAFVYNASEIPIIALNANGELDCNCAQANKANEIEFYETFLSFVWCVCYSLLVLWDEANVKPAKAGLYEPTDPEAIRLVRNARQLLLFGGSLITHYSRWDANTPPNPAYGEERDRYYVEKANGVFSYAVTFILLHELGHVALEHTKTLGQFVPTPELIDRERAADAWAIEHGFTNPTAPGLDVTRKCGAVAGLTALMLMFPSLVHVTHPDADDRLSDGLRLLQLPDDSAIWGIALLGVRLWEQIYNQKIDWPTEATDFQTVLIKTIRFLRQNKR